MPLRVQAIPLQPPKFFHEGSHLRSYRDSDMVSTQWKKNKDQAAQIAALTQAVKRLQDEMNKLRLRKGGSDAAVSVCPYG